jgi:predicted transcriptional regulator
MADDSIAQKIDRSLVAEIVGSYVAQNSVGVDQLASLITTVHRTLSGLGESTPTPVPETLEPAVPIRRSVQRDHVVCLECGYRGQVLRRHLRMAHGLEPAAYRVRWKLSVNHPITAPAYSERRSTMAKEIGLGRGAPVAAVPMPAPEVIASPPAKRRGRQSRSRSAVAE